MSAEPALVDRSLPVGSATMTSWRSLLRKLTIRPLGGTTLTLRPRCSTVNSSARGPVTSTCVSVVSLVRVWMVPLPSSTYSSIGSGVSKVRSMTLSSRW